MFPTKTIICLWKAIDIHTRQLFFYNNWSLPFGMHLGHHFWAFLDHADNRCSIGGENQSSDIVQHILIYNILMSWTPAQCKLLVWRGAENHFPKSIYWCFVIENWFWEMWQTENSSTCLSVQVYLFSVPLWTLLKFTLFSSTWISACWGQSMKVLQMKWLTLMVWF